MARTRGRFHPAIRGVALLAAAAAAGGPSRAHAIVLESLDLASLLHEAELVVLVQGFQTAGMTHAGSGTVIKVFKGDHPVGSSILIVPWAIDLTRGGNPPGALTGVFFLEADPRGGSWGVVSSGARVMVQNAVHGVLQAGGSGPFILAPARRESVDSRKVSKAYDLAGLEEDILEARDRARRIAEELEAPSDRDVSRRAMKLIDEEVLRLFQGGGAVTRSDLVLKLARKLAGAGELEQLWNLRSRVPRERMGREVDELIADRASLEFLLELLRDVNTRMEAVDFCAETGFRIRNEIKKDLTKRILEFTREMPRPRRARGYAAAAALYRGTEIDPEDPLLPQVLETLHGPEGGALYHMGSALAERQPDIARTVLPDARRVFALVTIDEGAGEGLSGSVELRRFPGEQVLRDPVIILERVLPDGSILERRREPLGSPSANLLSGKAGTSAAGFRMRFRERLAGGAWRAFLEMKVEEGAEPREWRSGATAFDVGE